MMMNARNPVRNSSGGIDCEIEHPQLGWIPFTASPDDPEEHGRLLYAQLDATGLEPYQPPAEPA